MTVLEVSEEKVRVILEQFSERCGQDRIKFVQDGNGRWITSLENLSNPKFTFERTIKTETATKLETDLKTEVKKEPTLTVKDEDYTNIADLINIYGVQIEHVPIAEPVEEPEIKTETNGTK